MDDPDWHQASTRPGTVRARLYSARRLKGVVPRLLPCNPGNCVAGIRGLCGGVALTGKIPARRFAPAGMTGPGEMVFPEWPGLKWPGADLVPRPDDPRDGRTLVADQEGDWMG